MTPEQFEAYYQLPKTERMNLFKRAVASIEDDEVREFYQSLRESDEE